MPHMSVKSSAFVAVVKLVAYYTIVYITLLCSYVSPMKWEDILFLALLSVCLSVRLSVTLSCPLYIF